MLYTTRKPRTRDAGPSRNALAANGCGCSGARSTKKSPLSLYDGRRRVGSLQPCGDGRVVAHDLNGRALGVFPNIKAANAVWAAKGVA